MQGLCTAAECPYLHVNLSAGAPVCKAFLRGYCPAGADCPDKHYTLRMVKEERRLERAGSGGSGAGAVAGKHGKAEVWLGSVFGLGCFLVGFYGELLASVCKAPG